MAIKSSQVVKSILWSNVVIAFILFYVNLIGLMQLAELSPLLVTTGLVGVMTAMWNIAIAMVLAQVAYDLYQKPEESSRSPAVFHGGSGVHGEISP